MPNYVNTQSTVKLQTIVNLAKARGDINPVLNTSWIRYSVGC